MISRKHKLFSAFVLRKQKQWAQGISSVLADCPEETQTWALPTNCTRGAAPQGRWVSCCKAVLTGIALPPLMTEALDLQRADLEGFLLQDLGSPAVLHSTHLHSPYIPSLHYPSVQVLELWCSKFNRRLLKGYTISLLLSPCRKKHTQTQNKTGQTISTYKNTKGNALQSKAGSLPGKHSATKSH